MDKRKKQWIIKKRQFDKKIKNYFNTLNQYFKIKIGYPLFFLKKTIHRMIKYDSSINEIDLSQNNI